ncbi:MAG: type VI secretion system protein TssA [Desulfohalobiaceae bacterium]
MVMDILELGLNPISDARPAGEDVRYSQDFDALQEQIDLLSEARPDGSSTDWEKVRKICVDILANKSKDLNVAVYLAVALQNKEGLPGLASGAKLLQGLSTNFWESMHPPKKRMRGRLNAYSWWKEKSLSFLKSNLPDEAQDKNLVQGLQEAVKALDETLGNISDDAPTLREILEQIERIPVAETEAEQDLQQQAEAQKESSPAIQQNQDQNKQASTQPQISAQPSADAPSMQAQDADKLLRQGLNLLLSYKEWLAYQNPKDPRVFRINRWAAWSDIQSLPPLDASFTRLPPPEGEISTNLEQLLSNSKFEQALQKAEMHLQEYPFWLDLNYASARALQSLDDSWKAALRALEAETAFFVQRLPGVEHQCFNDGTPFCEESTLAWIESLTKGSGASHQEQEAQDQVQKAVEEAQKMASENNLAGGLLHLDQALKANSCLRDRYRLQVGMLQLLIQRNNFELATYYSERVVSMIDRHRLQEWEPELALEGLQLTYRALKGTQAEDTKKQAQEIFSRMVGISPASALRFSGASD